MKLTSLSLNQKKRLSQIKEDYVKSALTFSEINDAVATSAIKAAYSCIKKEMPKMYKVCSPFDIQVLANKLKGTKNTFYTFGSFLTIGWQSFYAFYDTFVELGIITKDKFPKYFQLREFLNSGIFLTVEFEKAIIVCEKPIVCKKNTNGLHSVDGYAIKWRNGYGLCFVNGVAIPKASYSKLIAQSYTFEDWAKETNEEVKSAALSFMEEKWGSEYLFRFISNNLKEVDTYTDKKEDKYLEGTTRGMNIGVYTLFKGRVGNVDIAFVRCYCPSSDRMFFLCVDSANKNAKDAIASLYRVPVKLKGEIKYIQRQGERFSTVFTENGKKMLPEMTKEEVSNLTHISGTEYFKKMKYEY